jgi:hypothetical protein
MDRKPVFSFVLVIAALALAATSRAQIVLGQVDDFQDGTLQGWGGGASLSNVATGGPSGAGDRFLQVQSFGGFGGGSRLATFNSAQWTGDYAAAGVTAVSLFMRNLGQTDLAIRLVLFDLTGTDERWTSTVAQPLVAGGGWQFMTFSVAESSLTRVQGTGTYANLMADVDRLMFRHQSGTPDAEGDSIAAIAGMDNVRAVPEPASLLALGLGVLFLRRRKH